MSLFDNLFKKQNKSTDLHFDKKTSKINGTIQQRVNNVDLDFPVDTSIQQMDEEARRKNNPNSCERKPREDEVMISINDDCIFSCPPDVVNQVSDAILKGYNNIVIPKELYIKAKEDRKQTKELSWKISRTAELNNIGIAAEKEGRIEDAIAAYEENIAIGYTAFHSYDRLITIYRKLGRKEDERRVVVRKMEVFGWDKETENQIKKIDGTYVEPEPQMPDHAEQYTVSGETMAERFNKLKMQMVEFDFYNSGEHGRVDRAFKSPIVKEIWEMQREFSSLVNNAERFERERNYVEAAKIYERIMAEKYEMTSPYDRLIKIYSRAKLKDEEKRVLEYSINFFANLRQKQKDYVLMLARKYDKENFAIERIESGKKITYYSGLYELYNPFLIIEKWKSRLEKLVK